MDTLILREGDYFATFPSTNRRHNYGCFRSFRKNVAIFSPGVRKKKIGSDCTASYAEFEGECCRKLLKQNGQSNKVILYAEESWASAAASTYWLVKPSWWRRNVCTIEEVAGCRRYKAKGEIINCRNGSLLIVGSFSKKLDEPDFKLQLSSNISPNDFNMGYCMTGTLERGWAGLNKFQVTHFAVVKKSWPDSSYSAKSGFKLL